MSSGAVTDRFWMRRALELAGRCPRSEAAFSVGAVIVGPDGADISDGYSRETDPKVHAEESALGKLADVDQRLAGSTLYSTLEPCSERASRSRSCAQLIVAAGIPRVVFGLREPTLYVANPRGVELLTSAGVRVDELTEFAPPAWAVNAHLLTE